MGKAGDPRNHRRLRQQWRLLVLATHGPTCAMPTCKMPDRAIDLKLKAPHPGSYTTDHIVEIQDGGAPFDVSNGRPAHWGCNSSAGAASGNRRRKATTDLTW